MKYVLAIGLALLLSACGQAGPDDVLSESFGAFDAQHRCMDWKGTNRCYYVVAPKGKPKRLLVALHPAFTPVKMTEKVSHLARDLVPQGYLVVYPEGIDRQWNDGRVMEQVKTYRDKTDDVGFINAVTATMQKEYGFAAKNTTLAGMSNGGMMSLRLACESDLYGSAATIVANLPQGLRDKCRVKPKRMLMIFGTHDDVVHYSGGILGKTGLAKDWGVVESAKDTEQFFAARNGCKGKRLTKQTLADPAIDDTKAHITRYDDCAQPYTSIHVENMGHTWPGEESRLLAWLSTRGAVSKQFNGTLAIRDFIENRTF